MISDRGKKIPRNIVFQQFKEKAVHPHAIENPLRGHCSAEQSANVKTNVKTSMVSLGKKSQNCQLNVEIRNEPQKMKG